MIQLWLSLQGIIGKQLLKSSFDIPSKRSVSLTKTVWLMTGMDHASQVNQ